MRRPGPPVSVDGGAQVKRSALLDAIRRVVFLSVPHHGTNIADWVRAHPVWRDLVVTELRAAVASSQMPFVSRAGSRASAAAARWMKAQLFCSMEDALTEANPLQGRPGLWRLAEAHEAASQLDLYLRHIASDFGAIDDLAAEPPKGERTSPAHFTSRQRDDELRLWESQGIATRSYATLGPRVFPFEPGRPAPVWELAKPWTGLAILRPARKIDIVYRACYRACAGGPFSAPSGSAALGKLESWDNDGIVNTASMYWPMGENTLVDGDHMDIVGHFEAVGAPRGCCRRFRAYDLLGCAAGFTPARFAEIWNGIFTWAVHPAARTVPAYG